MTTTDSKIENGNFRMIELSYLKGVYYQNNK